MKNSPIRAVFHFIAGQKGIGQKDGERIEENRVKADRSFMICLYRRNGEFNGK